MKKSHKLYTALIFLFMYLPIFVLILYSFNDGKTTVWKGFTLDWYVDLFKDKLIMNALLNTMLIAVLASLIATVLGTAAAIGINNFKGKKRVIIQNVSNISILTPDVVTGVALMLMFTIAGITFHFQMGFWTVLLAHISFCTPYVVLSVLPRLRRMDYSIYEAALDLGCNQFQAFYKVVLHELMPGIFTGFLMSFTYSLDDFVITYFTRGSSFQTLPVQIYTMTHQRISPKINALSALMFVAIVIIMLVINFKDRGKEKEVKKESKPYKKYIAIALAVVIIVSSVVSIATCNSIGGNDNTQTDNLGVNPMVLQKAVEKGFINVYNWGEYISDGSKDYVNVIEEFEKTYNIKVNYSTYETNEQLYNILSTTNSAYDVVIPSDYMVEKLIKENLVQKLDFANIPNYDGVMDSFKNLEYDPTNEYSVPYQWGVVGMVYNKTMIKNKPTSWNDLWNEDYKGSILQFNNSRDAFAIAMQLEGVNPNSFTKEDIDKVTVKLKEQKPVIKKYVMDQVFAEMENNQSAIAPYYAGDIITMMDNNPNLDCALPKEGSNLYVDAMCVPTSAQNKEGAELFINFMTSAEISKANTDYICYATPVQGAYDMLDKEVRNDKFIYPTAEYLEKCYTFKDVDSELYAYMQEQFVKLMS